MTCIQAAEIISRSLDTPPGLGTRVGLGVHLACCRSCRRYRQQIRILHTAAQETDKQDEPPTDSSPGGLPAEARERIASALERS
jgi:hypothetical protein